MNKFSDIPVFSKFADNVIELSRARGRFADELFEPPVVALVSKFADVPEPEMYLEAGTVGKILSRYMDAMKPTKRAVGLSGTYSIKGMMRAPLGAKSALKLTSTDIFAHAQWRLARGVKPSTVDKDISMLAVALKYAGSAWPDCEGVKDKAITDAKPFLTSQGMISSSGHRDRRVSGEEIERLCFHFYRPNDWNRRRIPMALITMWQRYSARRIGETCRLLWSDWDRETSTILVRKMKDPRTRNKNKLVAIPEEGQAILCAMWEVRDPDEPRIFPYRAESCIAAFVAAKDVLGIEGMHLHDLRAECATWLMEDKGYSPLEVTMVTGHETTAMLESRYKRLDPTKFRLGPIKLRLAA